MKYDYHIAGPEQDQKNASNRIHQASMEAGERWILNDAAGKPVRAWDSRGFLRRMTYDELRRPTGLYVTENNVERLAERTVYGESRGDAANHRTRVYQVFDGAGIVTSIAYDFNGNLLEGLRELLPGYKQAVDWVQNPLAIDGSFISRTTYDALNRPVTATSPDNSIYRPTFNEANLLDKVHVNLRGAATATAFVTNIDYDAKGQRKRIDYGNGALTIYEYDPLTYRLINLKTTRPANTDATASQLFQDAAVAQDLSYTYDPVGNLTNIEDTALRTVYYNGQAIDPVGRYTYDAMYRLIETQGREHIGQAAFAFTPTNNNYRDYPFVGTTANPNDLQALRNYLERYEYDTVGNFEKMRHSADGGGWTRTYDYEEDSLIESAKKSNRLTRTTVGNGFSQIEPYTHDVHGNMTSMPHLANMVWDFEDQLQQVDLAGGGKAYYVYDAAGQRIRKVIESQTGVRQKERIYLGGFEIYREYSGNGAISLERETLHVMDDKQRIALVDTRTQGNDGSPAQLIRYQFGNHLGSASVELDIAGALISYEEYYPYGTTAFQAGRSAAEVSQKRYRYTGKERDDETGFSYHGARYYAPWLGRWTSCDPTGVRSDHENLFEYVRSNPIIFHDPNGKEEKGSVLKEIAQGDFYEGESTWTGTGLNVVVGLIPVVGQIADIRDTAAAAKNVWQKPSWGTTGMLGLAIVGWVPLAGDIIKGGSKVGKKVLKEGAEAATETLEKGAKETLETGTEAGLEKGAKETTEKGTEEGLEKGSKETTEKGTEKTADKGTKEAGEKAKAAEVPASAELKPYGGPGGGHHVPAKSAFPGAEGYDLNKALAIPNEELARLNVRHGLVSGAQQKLYRAFGKTGETLTWEVMEKIETQALVTGGMKLEAAQATVKQAINALREAGVAGPTKIPWGK